MADRNGSGMPFDVGQSLGRIEGLVESAVDRLAGVATTVDGHATDLATVKAATETIQTGQRELAGKLDTVEADVTALKVSAAHLNPKKVGGVAGAGAVAVASPWWATWAWERFTEWMRTS